MRVLLTGAAGFVGSHIADKLIESGAEVVALDSLTYAGRLNNLEHLRHKGIQFVYHDFRYPLSTATLKSFGDVEYVIHNGAETHVSRSFVNPCLFVESNVIGTLNILEAARHLKPKKFIYVSTDEVYGPSTKPFLETNVLNPTNPYAATKAGAEYLAYSYYRCFGVPAVITRTMNMFGERQHPEKFVPLVIKKVLNNERIKIHAAWVGGHWVSGARCWLYAKEQASALQFLLEKGKPGEVYNISGEKHSNHFIAQTIGEWITNDPCFSNMEQGFSDRPVHDFCYSVDDSKIRNLGWKPSFDFLDALKKTVQWTVEHPQFLEE